MNDFDNDLDSEVDDIISQLKNQGKSLKIIEKEKPHLSKDDVEKFILDNASSVVTDCVSMLQSLGDEVRAGGDPKLIESVAEIAKAATIAIDALSKLKLSDDKIKAQKEIKQMDIDSKVVKETDNESKGVYLSREELLTHLFNHREPEKIEQPSAIDV